MSISKKSTLLLFALLGAAILAFAGPAEGADQCAPEQAEKMLSALKGQLSND